MGVSSRKKRARRDGRRREPTSASPLGPLVRQVRDGLGAYAEALLEGTALDEPWERIVEAVTQIQAHIAAEHKGGPPLDELAPESDRIATAFVRDIAMLSAMRLVVLPDRDEQVDDAMEGEIERAAELGAEELVAFEALSWGGRIAAIAKDPDMRTFVAAALCIFGPRWDPLAEDPVNEHDLGALVAGLAVARATLLLIAAAEGEQVEDLRGAIETAGVAVTTLRNEDRGVLADDLGPVAWNVVRALSAGFEPEALPTVRMLGGQVPMIFAAGAVGRGWLEGLDSGESFDENVDVLELAFGRIPKEELRQTVPIDPLIAAYSAGKLARRGRLGEWRLPWESGSTGPVH